MLSHLTTTQQVPDRAPRASGAGRAADEISARVIAAAAAENEIRLSVARAAFAAAILLRSVLVTEWSNARAAIGIPAIGAELPGDEQQLSPEPAGEHLTA